MQGSIRLLLLTALLGLASFGRADVETSSSIYHFEIKTEAPGPKPLGFPFGLTGGMTKTQTTAKLQELEMDRDDFDSDFTFWKIKKNFKFKGFHPNELSLRFRHDHLMQVVLMQPNMQECPQIMAMMLDAVTYIEDHYTLAPESIQKAAHYGETNCFYYVKPDQSGWGAAGGDDYAVNIDASWKDMLYNGYVTFTYMPIYKQPDDHIPDQP